MSQLTSSDNCEPRALSKGTTVIVLIGPPLLGWKRKMLSNVIAPQHLKIRHAHIEHQKRKMSAFYLPRTITWHSGTFPGLSLRTGTSSPISNCREWPRWPAEALADWAHGGWHSSWPIMMDMLIKVALASPSQRDWRTLPSRVGCAAALAAFPLYPSGPGHQANHWHKSLDAGGKKKKTTTKKKKNMAQG